MAIWCLTIYLWGYTPLGQLCKFPVLLIHFQEHKEENKNLSVSDFFKLHYFNSEASGNSHEENTKLPFKTFDINTALSIVILNEPLIFTSEKEGIIKQKSLKYPKRDYQYYKHYLSTIWQPPQA